MSDLRELEVAYRQGADKSPQVLMMGSIREGDMVSTSVFCVLKPLRKGTVLKTETGLRLRVNTSLKPTFSSVGRLELTVVPPKNLSPTHP